MINLPHDQIHEVYEDRLVIRWRMKDGTLHSQGKRQPASCRLTAEERHAYTHLGTVATVKLIRDRRGLSFSEAKALLDEARSEYNPYNWRRA